jgi:hypothetical protein
VSILFATFCGDVVAQMRVDGPVVRPIGVSMAQVRVSVGMLA